MHGKSSNGLDLNKMTMIDTACHRNTRKGLVIDYLIRISNALGSMSVMVMSLSCERGRGPSSMALKTGDPADSTRELASIFSVQGGRPS